MSILELPHKIKIVEPSTAASHRKLLAITHLLDTQHNYLYIAMSNEGSFSADFYSQRLRPLLNRFPDTDCIVLDFSYDPCAGIESNIKLWPQEIQLLILINDFEYMFDNNHSSIVYHNPFIQQYKQQVHQTHNNKKTNPISCLNGVVRKSRVELFNKLRTTANFNKMIFSLGAVGQTYNDYILRSNPDLSFECVKQFYAEFSTGYRSHDIVNDNYVPGALSDTGSVMHPAYKDTVLNIVTETSVEHANIFTEKTWKPIYAKQFFMQFNRPHAVEHLRRLGYDVFDDIIDHSYDLAEDYYTRLDLLVKEVDRLLSDTDSLFVNYEKSSLRLEHNFELLVNMHTEPNGHIKLR